MKASQINVQHNLIYRINQQHLLRKRGSLSYYLPIAGGRIIGFIPFPRVLVLCKMQSVLSKIYLSIYGSRIRWCLEFGCEALFLEIKVYEIPYTLLFFRSLLWAKMLALARIQSMNWRLFVLDRNTWNYISAWRKNTIFGFGIKEVNNAGYVIKPTNQPYLYPQSF